MKKESFKKLALRASAGLMGLLLSCGLLLSTAVSVKAAAPANPVLLSGGVTLDFDNPPALPDDVVPPQLGVGEELPGAISEIDLARLLVESAIGWALGKGMDFGSDKLLGAVFGTNENKQMEEVIQKQNQIIDLLNQMLNKITSLDYKRTIDEKTLRLNTAWEKYLNKSGAVADETLTAQQRKDILKPYFNGSGDNYVMQVIDLYVNYIEGKGMLNGNIFSTYDAYALYNFWWEHEGYDFRTSVRVLDMAKFMQMWTLAYAVCEAHVQDKTDVSLEAQKAQVRLQQLLMTQNGANNSDLVGLKELMEKWPVKRLAEHYFTFQVPGRAQRFYIPSQNEACWRQKEIADPKYNGTNAYDALYKVYFTIPDSADATKSHELTDYFATLQPVLQYYNSKGDKRGLKAILYEVTNASAFQSGSSDFKDASFLERRNFESYIPNKFANDYWYKPFLVDDPSRLRNAAEMWLDSHDDNARIRKVTKMTEYYWYSIYNADTIQTPTLGEEGDTSIAETSEVTDTGVVTATADGSFTLTVDVGQADTPVTEEVLVGPGTLLNDGSPLGMAEIATMLNNKIEVSGIYNFKEGTLAANTVTITDNDGTHDISGTVVSSVANAVMVQEDGTAATNGYLLPDVQGDIPTGSRITIQFHWEDGVKVVNSYELQDGPVPEPDPEPIDGPVQAPVPEPEPNPVDGPVSSSEASLLQAA